MAGLYEKSDSAGVTTHRHFIYADGKTIAVHERYSNANPDTTNYLHRDYQGSVDVITNSSGTELERFSYDAFGKRRFDDWTADASDGLYGAAYFGVAKPTSEIAARIAEVGSDVFAACWEPNVVWRRDQKSHDLPSVRVAASNPQTKRDVAQVPLMEIAAAIRVVVERAPGLTSADLVRESAKLLGFARFTADVKARIERGLEVATFANAVAVNAGRVALP